VSSFYTPSVTGIPPSQRGEPAWALATLFPAQGDWTEEEYLALDTNHLVELAGGCLEVHPVPTLPHQLIVRYLFGLLNAFVEARKLGFVLFAPLPVWLGPRTFREPDVVFLRSERARGVKKYPQGADLAMEVVSEGAENRQRDLETKPKEYAAARISEYWIVDPEQATITVLTLDGATYREHGVFRIGDVATSVLLPGFAAAVQDVLAAGQAAE
jgi:Uma2 family endonuclease